MSVAYSHWPVFVVAVFEIPSPIADRFDVENLTHQRTISTFQQTFENNTLSTSETLFGMASARCRCLRNRSPIAANLASKNRPITESMTTFQQTYAKKTSTFQSLFAVACACRRRRQNSNSTMHQLKPATDGQFSCKGRQ